MVVDDHEDAQCEKEQEELALSLTLLHNKTKTKIRVVREKLNNTDTEVVKREVDKA